MRDADQPLDPAVLGHLLVAAGGLHALPDDASLASYLVRALTRVPGVEGARVVFDTAHEDVGQAPGLVLPLATADKRFGSVRLAVADRGAFGRYQPFVLNLAALAAMALENRHHTEQLRNENLGLSSVVEAREEAVASLSRALDEMGAALEARSLALSESEGRLRVAERAGRIGTFDWDATSGVIELSRWAFEVLGLEAPGGRAPVGAVRDAIHPDDRPLAVAAFRAALEARQDLDVTCRVGTPPDGRWLSLHGWPLVGEDGRVRRVVGILVDVHEQKRLERELLQTEKLDSLGRLVGGVAHDFNNMLTAILGFAELAAADVRGAPAEVYIDEVLSAARRAADLVRRLLAFGRQQDIQAQPTDVNAIVGETASMLGRLLGERVSLTTRLQPGLPPVVIDPAQLGQIVTNVVVNARDAMPSGGTVCVATTLEGIGGIEAQKRGLERPGDYVVLVISDTGTGMSEAVRSRVFEPFFTTKPAGRGTGLGLAGAYGAVAAAKGRMWVESELGRGSTFTVALPAAAGASVGPPPAVRPGDGTRGVETVLLAEDEPSIRRIAVRALTARGYTVLEAIDGEAALATAASHQGSIDLVVTDRVMPRMTGDELLERIRQLRPDVASLIISGYADEPAAAPTDGQRWGFLRKPFGADDLALAVRRVLDGRLAPEA